MPIPKLIVAVALTAAQIALGMARKIKGPRLEDLSVSLADYGTPIPRFWGKRRLQPQIIWAEHLREKKTTSKTKGGKFQEYKYYGTWAMLICDHEIDSVSRIWLDKHLVYDRTTTGPISIGSFFANRDGVKLRQGKNYRVYDGTQTVPDPRMEDWCEDRYGADTCPAYTGSAYIVFEEVPLEKFGNRIPQVTVEAINNEVDNFPYEVIDLEGPFASPQFSTDGVTVYNLSVSEFQKIDVPTRSVLGANFLQTAGAGPYAVTPNGLFATNGLGTAIYFITFDGFSTDTGVVTAGWSGVHYAGGKILLSPGSFVGMSVGVYAGGTTLTAVSTNHLPSHFFTSTEGDAIGVGTTSGNVLSIGPALGSATLNDTSAYSTSGEAFGFDSGANYIVLQDDHLFLIDKITYTIVSAVSGVSTTIPWSTFQAIPAGADTFWVGRSEYKSSDLSTIRTIDPTDWAVPGGLGEVGSPLYDAVNHALLSGTTSLDPKLIVRYLDRIDSDGVQLKEVVDDVSGWCGLTTQDSTALTQTVLGYSVTQGTGKDMLAPLLDIHDVDPRPHDFSIQFVNRGASASGTLLTADFVKNDPRYSITVQQDTDLPRRLTYNFADEGKDQQTNTVISQRPLDATDSTREETIDLSTYVDTPDGAQQKADRYFRRLWNSRERPKNALTHQALALEPADVTTLNLDGVTRHVRLEKLTITPTTVECEWVRDEVTLSLLNGRTGGTMDGRDPETLYIPGPTKGFILDAPLVQDADNDVNPILYYAAGGYTPTWPGAAIYRGDDGTFDDLYGYVESTSGATFGMATEVLDTADPNLWDRGNTVEVQVYGMLTNATEAEINEDPTLNLCALGDDDRWEYLNFTTATLTGTSGLANVYTLSGFKRGRRGTEGNVGNHAEGDQFLVLSAAVPTEIGTDEIGNNMAFKAQTPGRNVDGATEIDLTYDGNSLKPYAPARLKTYYDGTDLQCTIIRRTRVGGAWTGGSTIPLAENSEDYEVDVYNGSTLKRTITVSDANTFTYTSAMAAADGITLPALPTFNVYQMSDTAGRGFALAA